MSDSLATIQQALLQQEYTCEYLVKEYLDAIKRTEHCNVYLEIWEEDALEKAKLLDKKIASRSSLGKLFGAVFSIKDVLTYEGKKVSAGSKMLSNYTANYTATVIQSIIDEDAIIIGRVNCDEFAVGTSTENPFYGTTKNPLNEKRISGGSSGGSAASVAAKTCLISLGSDTGGSVRQPSSFCGTYGFKPTYGTLSRYGLIAYASSFDQVGIIAKNTEDIYSVLEVVSKKEEQDYTQVPIKKNPFTHKDKFKIAIPKDFLYVDNLNVLLKERFLNFVNDLKKLNNVVVEEVNFHLVDSLVPTYYIISCAELSSNLSRFDGIRYGFCEDINNDNSGDWQEWVAKNRSMGFGIEVKRRILMGNYVLSSGFYDAYYKKALKVRRLFYDEAVAIFSQYDFLLCPTTPNHAREIGKTLSPVEEYLTDIFSVFANLVGIPALHIPCFHFDNSLTAGIQIMSGWFKDDKIFYFDKFLRNSTFGNSC